MKKIVASLILFYSFSFPVWANSCLPELSAQEQQTLILLSDTSTIGDIYDVQYRMSQISEILGESADPRGTFPVVYSVMTDQAVWSVSQGKYDDINMASDLLIEFASRYLANYHAYLVNEPVEHHWIHYFDLAEDCKNSPLRLAASGINSHITIDLAASVEAIGAPKSFKNDFDLYGEVLVEKSDVINEKLLEYYGVDGSEFFSGFFVGEWVDKFLGTGATTEFAFSTVRTQAWINGRLLQHWLTRGATLVAMNVSFHNRELILMDLQRLGLLD